MAFAAPRVFLLAFALVLVNAPAYAQQIYVKPAPTGTNQPKVEYGIKSAPPPKPVQTAPAPQAPVQQPTQPVQTAPQPAPMPVQHAQPQPVPAGPPPNNNGMIQIEKIGKAQIIKSQEDRRPLPQGAGSSVLNVNIQPGTLGAGDRLNVTRTLGLNDQQIQSACILQYQVLVDFGNNNGEMLYVRTAPQVTYKFNGPLNGISLFAQPACTKLQAPLNGMVVEESGRYILGGPLVACPKPTKAYGNIQVGFHYLGNGKAECTYQ